MILLIGGAGYVGSHVSLALLEKGFEVAIVDNLSNVSKEVLNRLNMLSGKNIQFYNGDYRDAEFLNDIFVQNKIDAVIHLAGIKLVDNAVDSVWQYYNDNLAGTLVLLNVMNIHKVKNLVFSSSAAVYGEELPIPYREDMLVGQCTTLYGESKVIIEDILRKQVTADNEWSVTVLRYFNPVGAHHSSCIGENLDSNRTNILTFVGQVAAGRKAEVLIFGDDYDTPDGTCLRDYIHVMDIAEGHNDVVKFNLNNKGFNIYNMGTGQGLSVLEIVKTYQKVSDLQVPYRIVDRRQGDLVTAYADVTKIKKEIGWQAKYNVEKMCLDAYKWQKLNPNGYLS